MAPAPRRVIRTITAKDHTSRYARETIVNTGVKHFLARFQKMTIEVSMQRQEHWIKSAVRGHHDGSCGIYRLRLALSIPILRQLLVIRSALFFAVRSFAQSAFILACSSVFIGGDVLSAQWSLRISTSSAGSRRCRMSNKHCWHILGTVVGAGGGWRLFS
jgi:hypothetical protein